MTAVYLDGALTWLVSCVCIYQTRLAHISPAELLLPGSRLSKPTEKMLEHFTA